MLINGAAIVGARVITKQDNKQLATVSDLVMNPKSQKIDAFLVNNSEPPKGKAVLMKDTKQVTQDEIVIESESAIKQVTNVLKTDTSGKKTMTQTKVITDQGKELGELKDIFFDTSSGKVQQLAVADKDQKEEGELLIQLKDIKSMQDQIIVKSQAVDGKKKQQSQKGLIGKAEQKTESVYNKMKQKLT